MASNHPISTDMDSLQELDADVFKEEKATEKIAGVDLFFISTECSDSLDNGKPWIIFLHGAKFSSKNWVDINLLRMTAKLGFNNIAIDLPGYGKTERSSAAVDDSQFIEAVVRHFGFKQYIVVSPSMSGQFSMPLLQKKLKELVGFVAVAPVNTALVINEAESIKTPTLVIVGDKDRTLGAESVDNLSKLKKSKVVKLADAGHACYLDKPEEFMSEFFQFLMCDVVY
ncbi:protein ABHD14A-like isoform X2 [Symsagittifera roscoffensis]|uniref:protein ABHD14A-like isoform X2 n=1 Tax=Symsagittifera roscoffensis TaxID=84072 RepID=UPI00307B8DE1